MAHVFDGKVYFTRDHLQGNFILKKLKLPQPNPAPKPQAKASSKASSSGEHVRLFRIVYTLGGMIARRVFAMCPALRGSTVSYA